MTPLANADFRHEDFETMRELRSMVHECAADMRQEFGAKLVEVAITESQHKWLKLDLYLHGTPASQLKKDTALFVDEVHVFVSKFEEGCPNCGEDLN